MRIVAEHLTHIFASSSGTVHALGPTDFAAEDEEFVCVIGPSGCGKSTLLRLIAGLLTPTRGDISFGGRNGAGTTATVFQDYSIFPWKTVLENVMFGLIAQQVPRSRAESVARDWVTRLGLADFADRYPHELSGGMKQRVGVARAFAVDPEVLLMDEPFGALDAQLRRVLQDELLRLWQDRRHTVVFVTHSLEEALLLGDRVLVMSSRPGRILESVEVPFDRPRDPAGLRTAPDFVEARESLWSTLESEVEL